nr:unnamed protein product [Naegleria fowleri]
MFLQHNGIIDPSDEFLLSQIFSYLKHETIYQRMSLVCRDWYQVISKGYFMGEEFYLDEHVIFEYSCTNIEELLSMKTNTSNTIVLNPNDNNYSHLIEFALEFQRFYSTLVFDPYYPERRSSDEFRLMRRFQSFMSKRFIHYLRFLQNKHGTIQGVKIVNMYEILLLDDSMKMIGLMSSLFPSVTIVRSALSFPYGRLLDYLLEIATGFDKLQKVYLLSFSVDQAHVLASSFEESSSTIPPKNPFVQQAIQDTTRNYPHVHFVNTDFTIYAYLESSQVVEQLITTLNRLKRNDHPPRSHHIEKETASPSSQNELYSPNEIFTSDLELLSTLKAEPWMLHFHVANENILTMAIRLKFRESVKYILSKNSALLTKSTNHLRRYFKHQSPLSVALTCTSPEDGILDDIILALQKLSKKSDEYIHDAVTKILPLNDKRILHAEPHSTLLDFFILPLTPQVEKYVHEKYGFDNSLANLLNYQTGYSFTHYILQHFPLQWTKLKTLHPEKVFRDFESFQDSLLGSNPLHALCSSHCPLSIFKDVMNSYYNSHPEILEQHLRGTTIGNQSPLHTLFFLNVNHFKEMPEKFWILWEKCGSILRKYLLLPNANGETPLELLLSCIRQGNISQIEDFIRHVVSQMALENEKNALQIFRKLCLQRKSFTLLYIICRALDGRLFPLQPDDEGYDFLTWTTNLLDSTTIKNQYYYVLKNGNLNFQYRFPKINRTLLHFVVESKCKNSAILIPFLIHFGVGVNEVDTRGNTCLHLIDDVCSRWSGEYHIAKLLRNMGAKVNIYNHDGREPCSRMRPRRTIWKSKQVVSVFICEHCLKYFTSQKAMHKHEEAKHAPHVSKE